MTKVVILGAGKTGRGFIPRFIKDAKLSFCDGNQELIDQLSKQHSYQLNFFNERPSISIPYETASCWGSDAARMQINQADVLCISIDVSNYPAIAEELSLILRQRQAPLTIITFENGINAGAALRTLCDEEAQANCRMLDAGVFCTTENDEGLSMISQDLDYLPIQAHPDLPIPFHDDTAIQNFADLMKRKLYTYNCLSALICYLGYCMHAKWLSDAANDPLIQKKIQLLLPELDEQVASLFQISLEDQQTFSRSAVAKFSDPYLKDPITRNARNVIRKLGEDERMMKPLRLLQKEAKQILLETIACACIYDKIEESQQGIQLLRHKDLSEEERAVIETFYQCYLDRLH